MNRVPFSCCKEMVKLLLHFGADPNAINVVGPTPLMEAAMWGHLVNVRYLVFKLLISSLSACEMGTAYELLTSLEIR